MIETRGVNYGSKDYAWFCQIVSLGRQGGSSESLMFNMNIACRRHRYGEA